MGDESAAGGAGEAYGDFMTRATRIEGLTKAKVLQGIGDVLQMEQILGPREWGENAGVVQIARSAGLHVRSGVVRILKQGLYLLANVSRGLQKQ